MILKTCLVKACLLHTCLLHLRVLLTFLTKPTTTVMFFVTDWVKVEIFFTQPLLTLFYLHFFTKNLILWLLFIIIYQVFMAQQCSPLALCHFKAKRWLAKNARETWLREWVASETPRSFCTKACRTCVCLSNNAFLRIRKHEYEKWNWVSAVHSQLCRALEEQKKTFESKHLRKDWEWILIQHAH